MLGTQPRARFVVQSLSLALCVCLASGFATPSPVQGGAVPVANRLADARRALLDGHPSNAIATLEAVLAASPPPTDADKQATLGLLREAYEAAANQAERAGRTRDAEAHRENAQIIARRVGSTEPAKTPAARPEPARPQSASAPAPPVPSHPTPLPFPDEPKPTIEPEPAAASTPTPAPAQSAPESVPPIDQSATDPPQASPAATPEGPRVEPATPGLREADAAFAARRYAEARQIYGQLASRDRLPAERRDHWAYCRSVEVARRINAHPSEADWQAIDAEIEQIRALAPDNWLGNYLRNKASARPSARRIARNGGGMVVRGASPEEGPVRAATPTVQPAPAPAPVAAPASAPVPTSEPAIERSQSGEGPAQAGALAEAAPIAVAPATSVPSAAGRPAVPPIGRWQTRESANFRVFHHNPKLAEQVVQIAEATRRTQIQRWTGKLPAGPWQPKCEIYLFPTAAQYAHLTGQPIDSPGFSTMGMNQGAIITRRVSLRTDHEGLLNAVLPHEITHVILADFFPEQQIPRWADEGIAVLTEPVAEQNRRAADLVEPLRRSVLFEVDKLMVMDYPDEPHWSLYYAQSVSLTRFLVEQGTPNQFIQFLQGAQQRGFDAELRRTYKINGVGDLQNRWIAYARNQASATGRPTRPEATAEPAAATAATTPRAESRVR